MLAERMEAGKKKDESKHPLGTESSSQRPTGDMKPPSDKERSSSTDDEELPSEVVNESETAPLGNRELSPTGPEVAETNKKSIPVNRGIKRSVSRRIETANKKKIVSEHVAFLSYWRVFALLLSQATPEFRMWVMDVDFRRHVYC